MVDHSIWAQHELAGLDLLGLHLTSLTIQEERHSTTKAVIW